MIIDFAIINIVIDKYRLAIVSLEYKTICENNLKFVFFYFFSEIIIIMKMLLRIFE